MQTTPEHPDPDGTVVYLPSARRDTGTAGNRPGTAETAVAPAAEIIDAELVPDAENAEIDARLQRQRGMLAIREASAVRAVVLSRRVAASERPAQAGRVAVSSVVATGQGFQSWIVRAWNASTHGVYRQQIKLAQIQGEREVLAEWMDRKEQATEKRFRRIMELPTLAWGMIKAALFGAVGLTALIMIIGLFVQISGKGEFAGVITGVFGAVGWAITAVTWAWTPFVMVLPAAIVIAAYREGRRQATPPAWVQRMTHTEIVDDVEVTPSIVVKALRDLGISEMRKAITRMDDHGAAMLSPIRIAGCGVEVDVRLPSGVDTEQVQGKRKRLAENLGRHEHELFISIPVAARTVRLWIADSGALDQPIGPSPLVVDPPAAPVNLYRDRAPWGQNLRGDAVTVSLLQRHLLITGLSNQGKTAALRALVLWLIFIPGLRLRIADLKGLGDWRMFQPLAEQLIEGPSDEHVMDATHMLEWGVSVMEDRMSKFDADKYPNGVGPELAVPGGGFEPIVLLVDEAQQAFMCPVKGEDGRQYGGTKATSRYFTAARKLHNQGRAVNVILWQGTQDPTDQNLPKLVREGAHIRAALAVGTESQSRMAVGEKAVDAGAQPHKLRQGKDKGTLVITGDAVDLPDGETSMTVRTHYIDGAAATEIVQQAVAMRGEVDPVEDDEPAPRDVLADIATVLGDQARMPTPQILQLLGKLDHSYVGWPLHKLTAALADTPAAPYKTEGKRQVSAEKLVQAIAERDQMAAGDPDES